MQSTRTIAPLIEHRELIDDQLKVTFCCPLTGVRTAAGVKIPKPSLLRRIADFLLRRQTDRQAEEALRDATLRAFRQVSDRYHWDDVAGCWLGKVPVTSEGCGAAFRARLAQAPVRRPSDRALLGRMLAELTLASSRRTEPDPELFETILGPRLNVRPLTDMHPGVPLTPAELEAVTPGLVRETTLMIAWAVTFTGEQPPRPREQRLLEGFASGLGIGRLRAEFLRRSAQLMIFEIHLGLIREDERDPVLAHDRAIDTALVLGLDPREAEGWAALHRQLHPHATGAEA